MHSFSSQVLGRPVDAGKMFFHLGKLLCKGFGKALVLFLHTCPRLHNDPSRAHEVDGGLPPISKIVKYLLITPIIYSQAPNYTLFEIGAPNYTLFEIGDYL